MAKRGTQEWRDNISRGQKTNGEDPLAAAIALPTSNDIAWAAGFYEGEGCCHKTKNNLLTVKVVQVDREPLDKLQKFFGGRQSRWVRRKDSRGYWQWQISGNRARTFMNAVMTLLSARRQDQYVQQCKKGTSHGEGI